VSAQKDVTVGQAPIAQRHTWDGHFAPGIECGAIGARPYLRLIKPAPSAQSAAVITAATATSVKNASEAKIRCFILAGPMMLPCERNCQPTQSVAMSARVLSPLLLSQKEPPVEKSSLSERER
jgi:hypothetical protein